jgi:hypothetical protein
MKKITKLLVLACTLATALASADDLHPALQSNFHFDIGGLPRNGMWVCNTSVRRVVRG